MWNQYCAGIIALSLLSSIITGCTAANYGRKLDPLDVPVEFGPPATAASDDCEEMTDPDEAYYVGKELAEYNANDAMRCYRVAAARGHGTAQRIVGVAYITGVSVRRDRVQGMEMVRRAAMLGDPVAIDIQDFIIEYGIVIFERVAIFARDLLKKAEKGDAQSQFLFGALLYLGVRHDRDRVEAVKWIELAATNGVIEAQDLIGQCYRIGEGVKRDYAVAVQWFQRAAKKDHANAQFHLGEMYFDGLGVKKDEQVALRLEARAAEQGSAKAHTILGWAYLKGRGVTQDMQRALNYLHTGDKGGDKRAGAILAEMYEEGIGVDRDLATAHKWRVRAAEQGDLDSQLKLADMYMEGKGVPRDVTTAAKWYRLAADIGNPGAQLELAALQLSSAAGADKISAVAWLMIVADNRFSDAATKKAARDQLAGFESKLSKRQLDNARRRAKIWFSSRPWLR